ncbi:MAG: thiolase C-terminal domain-containing protein [Candidatus Helarchaeota archaeon]
MVTHKNSVAMVDAFYIKPQQMYLDNFEDLAVSAAIGLIKKLKKKHNVHLSMNDFDAIFLSSATASNVIGKEGQASWESMFASNFGLNIDLHAFPKGSESLHHAITEIKAGESDLILILGTDKRSDEEHTTDISDKGIDPNLKLWNWKWQNVYACAAAKYLYETELSHDDLIAMAINDRYNSTPNHQKKLKDFLPMIEKSEKRPLYDPLTIDDFAPIIFDGAAAVLLCSLEKAHELVERPIIIKSSASVTSSSEFWNQENTLTYPALTKASSKAYKTANITPQDIDVVSIDTKVTIIGPLVLEGLGLMKFPALQQISKHIINLSPDYNKSHIKFELDSGKKLIINPSGSTYNFGNIPGVSGLYRLIALYEQLTGQAENQVDIEPNKALLQEQSASGMKQMVHILEVE